MDNFSTDLKDTLVVEEETPFSEEHETFTHRVKDKIYIVTPIYRENGESIYAILFRLMLNDLEREK